jgi:hypothetical protein
MIKKFFPFLVILTLPLLFAGCSPPAPLVGEGYKNIPWGTSESDFRHHKQVRNRSDSNNEIGLVFANTNDPQIRHKMEFKVEGYFVRGLIQGYKAFKTIHSDKEIMWGQHDFMLQDGFSSLYVEQDDTVFCFYQNKCFAGLTVLDQEGYQNAKTELDKKYKFIRETAYPTFGEIEVFETGKEMENNADLYQFKAACYSAGNNTSIYLVKTAIDSYLNIFPDNTYGLVYTCKDCLASIGGDYQKEIIRRHEIDKKLSGLTKLKSH